MATGYKRKYRHHRLTKDGRTHRENRNKCLPQKISIISKEVETFHFMGRLCLERQSVGTRAGEIA